jgi:hypothetical protein
MSVEERYEWPAVDPRGELTGEAWEIYRQLACSYIRFRQAEVGENVVTEELSYRLVDRDVDGNGRPKMIVRPTLELVDASAFAGLRAVSEHLASSRAAKPDPSFFRKIRPRLFGCHMRKCPGEARR